MQASHLCFLISCLCAQAGHSSQIKYMIYIYVPVCVKIRSVPAVGSWSMAGRLCISASPSAACVRNQAIQAQVRSNIAAAATHHGLSKPSKWHRFSIVCSQMRGVQAVWSWFNGQAVWSWFNGRQAGRLCILACRSANSAVMTVVLGRRT